jgi:homoserine O-succinyltransferase/O-acetyltransferase
LQIALLNLMPEKIKTETQLLRVLGATPLQIEMTLLGPGSHESKNTPQDHLTAFYKTWEEVQDKRFDALIVTGAPVEHHECLQRPVYLLGRTGSAASLPRPAEI